MDVDFELSQQLQGHESQVRCIAVLSVNSIATGALDSQVILWRRATPEAGFELHKRLTHHADFIYALAPSHAEPGAFYSGSKDKTAVKCNEEGSPVIQYVGHDGPVCSVVECGAQVVTGAWDGKAKVWDSATAQCKFTLDAGAHAVTVAVLPTGEIVTGSQDRSLRVFQNGQLQHKVEEAHGDIIRAISCSSTHLMTASNDQCLKMWSFDGCEMSKLAGHQSFVYGVTHSADGQTIISSSDDCTLKMWSVSDLSCKQSLIHAGTVWSGAALPNGDVVTACSDMIVRVWTANPERMASEAERQTQKEMAEQAAVAAAQKGSSSVPMDTAVPIEKMPETVGKKNGEIKCFKDGGTVFAFSWNAGARQWDKIGEVVGQEEQKKFYEGDPCFPSGEYDFIFDVDMGTGMGMRRLPYNKGQNPMEVAEGFCSREQINKSNSDQIRLFIIQNAGEGSSSQAAPAPAPAAAPPREHASAMFPVMSPAVFKDGKFEPLQNKILEFNGQVDESLKLTAVDVGLLGDAIAKLKAGVASEFRQSEKEVIFVKLKAWPQDKLFPVVDLWRLFNAHPVSSDLYKGSDRGVPFITQVLGGLSAEPSGPLGLCCARYIANLFIYQTNRYAIFDKRDLVYKCLEGALATTNKHTKIACTSILMNVAIVLHESSPPPKQWDAESSLVLARLALGFLDKAAAEDADAMQRALLAVGTLLPRDQQNEGAVTQLCKEAGLPGKLGALEAKVGPVAAELQKMLA
mmetsp:Transcript_39387/g.116794  ORF Transcript_39387/g.116794 Transcript_39387/m.116794 type:complete len:743 (-) Transcript_39387:20-2248(-)